MAPAAGVAMDHVFCRRWMLTGCAGGVGENEKTQLALVSRFTSVSVARDLSTVISTALVRSWSSGPLSRMWIGNASSGGPPDDDLHTDHDPDHSGFDEIRS